MSNITAPSAPIPYDGLNSKAFGTVVEDKSLLRNIRRQPSTNTHTTLNHYDVVTWGEHVLHNVLNLPAISKPTILVTNDDFRSTMWVGWGISGGGEGQNLQMAIVSNNSKQVAMLPLAAITLGFCTNGMSNSLDLGKTKHTSRVADVGEDGMNRWQRTICKGFQRATDGFRIMDRVSDSHRQVILDRSSKVHQEKVHSTIMKLMLSDVINPASTKKMYDYWMSPMSQESKVHSRSTVDAGSVDIKPFKEDESVWSLVQAATAVDRGKNVFTRHKRNAAMLDIIAADYGTLDSQGKVPQRDATAAPLVNLAVTGAEF